MEDIRFTKEHYYIIMENDLATVGLTEFVLDKIKEDISIVELPEINSLYNKSDQIGSIVFGDDEIPLYTPFTGEMTEINENLISEPDTIKDSNYDNNWLFRIYLTDLSELNDTMSKSEYEDYLETL
jgi:glycine cleavage system H protein